MRKVVFIVNAPEYFISHRLSIGKALQARGWEVHVVSPPPYQVASGIADPVGLLTESGFFFHEIPISRGGQNPVKELLVLFRLKSLIKKIKPDLLHLVTLKPVLYGGLVGRAYGIPTVAAVAGLGTAFIDKGVLSAFRRMMIVFIMRLVMLRKNIILIFQNNDDVNLLLSVGAIESERVRIIKGSGVDLEKFSYREEPQGAIPVVVMVARLIRDKGVYEFIDAVRHLKACGINIDARLVGAPDPGNPSSITDAELKAWGDESIVSALGHRDDIAEQYAAANIVCLPSYREGLPKSLIEAAACGRAIVTTDAPGCRDAVMNGITGLLVPVGDHLALAESIKKLLINPCERTAMGRFARDFAEENFNINLVVEKHLNIYGELLEESLF